MVKSKVAALDAIEVMSEVTGTESNPKVKSLIVLLHGFGADNSDLATLSGVVDPQSKSNWCFPNAPHVVPIGPHMTGRAWFPLRLAELERQGVDFTQVTPEGMDRAVDQVLKAIDALKVKHSLSWNQIVIGGFSQGAMIAMAAALKAPSNFAGVTLFSGSLVDEPKLREQAAAHKGLKFFQSHGQQDPMLPFPLAERLDSVLNESGLDGMLYSFRGGHEIPAPVLREWTSWLKGLGFLS